MAITLKENFSFFKDMCWIAYTPIGQTRNGLLPLLGSGGGSKKLPLHGLLDVLIDDGGSSSAQLVASNQSLWILLGKGQNSYQCELVHVELFLDGFEKDIDLPKFSGNLLFFS